MKVRTIYRTGIMKVGLVEVERDLEIRELDDIVIQGVICGFCKSDVETILGKNEVPVEIFGHEGAGFVYEVGKGVNRVKVGDFVATYGDGCYGDFYKVKEHQVALVHWGKGSLPQNTIVQPLATMLNVANTVIEKPVLVNGCGSNALILGKIFKRRGIEFDFIGDHNVEKMEDLGGAHYSGKIKLKEYKVVVEISGKQGAYNFLVDLLEDEGLFVGAANPENPEPFDLFKFSWKAITVKFPSPRNHSFKWDFRTAATLLNTGSIGLEDIFDKCYNRNSEKELQQALLDKIEHKVTKGYLVW